MRLVTDTTSETAGAIHRRSCERSASIANTASTYYERNLNGGENSDTLPQMTLILFPQHVDGGCRWMIGGSVLGTPTISRANVSDAFAGVSNNESLKRNRHTFTEAD